MATAPKKKPSIKPPSSAGMVAILSITSSRPGFRRAGYVFGKEAVTIPLADLNDAQIAQLNEEPLLTITETEIEAQP